MKCKKNLSMRKYELANTLSKSSAYDLLSLDTKTKISERNGKLVCKICIVFANYISSNNVLPELILQIFVCKPKLFIHSLCVVHIRSRVVPHYEQVSNERE